MEIDVYVEAGRTKVFASALDWPGWCRSGKGEAAAIEALAAYAPRYSLVALKAGLDLPVVSSSTDFRVVERLEGNATTEFGAPAIAAARDHEPFAQGETRRLADILGATWDALNEVAAKSPLELRKG